MHVLQNRSGPVWSNAIENYRYRGLWRFLAVMPEFLASLDSKKVRAKMQRITELAELWAQCHSEARKSLAGRGCTDEETIRMATSEIFQAMREAERR